MPTALQKNAQNRFWRMFRIVSRDRRRIRPMPRRSPFTSVMPADSIATSVPDPMAMPTLRLQGRDRLALLVGKHLGLDLVDAELP